MPEHLIKLYADTEGILWVVQMPYQWNGVEKHWMAGPCETCGAFGLAPGSLPFTQPSENVHYCYRRYSPTETPELAAYDEAWE